METITPDEFEKLVAEGMDRIPKKFREKIDNLAVIVADEPSDEELARVGLRRERGETLLGLYEGVPPVESAYREFPDRITIFRLPILAEAGVLENVPDVVAETVRHEIAHHFDMTDEEIDRLENRG
jgi:predicted Zn-dependent protease with MMP-like domain